MVRSNSWSLEEDNRLRDNIKGASNEKLKSLFPNRTLSAIISRARQLGVKKGTQIKGQPMTDLTGKRYNHLVVLKFERMNKYGKSLWLCRCDCGNKKLYMKYQLESGAVKGCGCLIKKHGLVNTRLHCIWQDIKQRCFNKKNTAFEYYGGRGITMCAEWKNDFMVFYDWAMSNGYKDDLTIDRIDANGNYEPNNCRWVTRKEQQQNLRCNKRIAYNGETHTYAEWSRILNIPPNTIWLRANTGRSVEEILSTNHLSRRKEVCKN